MTGHCYNCGTVAYMTAIHCDECENLRAELHRVKKLALAALMEVDSDYHAGSQKTPACMALAAAIDPYA